MTALAQTNTDAAAQDSALNQGMHNFLEDLLLSGYGPRSLLDLGANIGLFSMAFQQYFPKCKITLVEPNPECLPLLQKSGCEVAAIAASAENGTATLHMTKLDPYSTGVSLYRERTEYFNEDNLRKVEVPKARLDDYFAGRQFDFIKIDIQGSELDALRGGERIIRGADYVLIELSLVEYNEGEPPMEMVAAAMRKMGFHVVDLVEYHRLASFQDGQLIQIDALFERNTPRVSQSYHYGAYDKHERLLTYLAKQREMSSDYTVIDIGAAANPWSASVIDATFDMNDCSAAKLHFRGDLNTRAAWQPLLDHVAKHGKFSYSICSHTLEDIAYPALALEMLPLIAERGYLAVPSRFTEFLRHEGPYRGYIHHRWIYDAHEKGITLYPKLGFIEHMAIENEQQIMGRPEFQELRLFWRRGIAWDIANGDYMGPNINAVVQMFAQLYSKPL